jgi:hypothetical protein
MEWKRNEYGIPGTHFYIFFENRKQVNAEALDQENARSLGFAVLLRLSELVPEFLDSPYYQQAAANIQPPSILAMGVTARAPDSKHCSHFGTQIPVLHGNFSPRLRTLKRRVMAGYS